jgi:hypothetical protein
MVGLDGETSTEPGPSKSPRPDGLHSWGFVAIDGSESTPAPGPSAAPPAAEKPLKAWGLVPVQ